MTFFLSVDPEYCLNCITVDRDVDEASPETGGYGGKWPARQDSNLQPTA
jgi:hypothetical protein